MCDEGGGSPGGAGTVRLCVGAAPGLEGIGRHLASQLALGAGGLGRAVPTSTQGPGGH